MLGILNLFFYFWIGNSLTRYWGDFRITLYLLLGTVGTWIGAFLTGAEAGPSGVYLSMLFAYCWMWPNQQVLLWGIIPFKMKYLGWFELALWLLQFNHQQLRQPGQPGAGHGRFCGLLRPGDLLLVQGNRPGLQAPPGTGTTATTPGTDKSRRIRRFFV